MYIGLPSFLFFKPCQKLDLDPDPESVPMPLLPSWPPQSPTERYHARQLDKVLQVKPVRFCVYLLPDALDYGAVYLTFEVMTKTTDAIVVLLALPFISTPLIPAFCMHPAFAENLDLSVCSWLRLKLGRRKLLMDLLVGESGEIRNGPGEGGKSSCMGSR